jgi:hypothetical protein
VSRQEDERIFYAPARRVRPDAASFMIAKFYEFDGRIA